MLKYADAHADQIELAARHYADGQPKQAERLVHSLKGAAGFIGASRVYALADAMEEAIRNQESSDAVAQVAAPLAAAQAQLVTGIRTQLGSLPAEPQGPVHTH